MEKGVNLKPLHLLGEITSSRVLVQLRGEREYRGRLLGYDTHMNLVLVDAEEIMEGEKVATHKRVILRGDNVIFISP